MRRKTWKFEYTVAAVAEGAQTQLDYHRLRLEAWIKARDVVKAKIKDDGIEITESVVEKLSSYSNTSNSFGGPQVNIKPEYLTELQECNTKITQRKASAADYESWVSILEKAPPEKILKLTQEDWMFFFNTK